MVVIDFHQNQCCQDFKFDFVQQRIFMIRMQSSTPKSMCEGEQLVISSVSFVFFSLTSRFSGPVPFQIDSGGPDLPGAKFWFILEVWSRFLQLRLKTHLGMFHSLIFSNIFKQQAFDQVGHPFGYAESLRSYRYMACAYM